VGNAQDAKVRTGVTVVMADRLSTAVVDVRGGAPGTRDTDALDPTAIDGGADAIVLSGGSVYGLDAPAGVTSLLREQGRGVLFGGVNVPIVPGAILFDLTNGGDKNWGAETPYRALGRAAAENAGSDFALGNAGAGLGARAGAYKGGLGSASAMTDDGLTVGAVAAVNSLGSPLIPGTDVFWTFPLEQAGEFGGRRLKGDVTGDVVGDLDLPADMKGAAPKQNTTIAVVAVDA
jgi:L-aminopeptidase/D-esterase-like protein